MSGQHVCHTEKWNRITDYILSGQCECGFTLFNLSASFDTDALGVKAKNNIFLEIERLSKEADRNFIKECNNVNKELDLLSLPAVPPKPEHSTWEIRKYYDANKVQILDEITKYGLHPVLKRWKISDAAWRGHRDGVDGLARRFGCLVDWTKSKKNSPARPPARRVGLTVNQEFEKEFQKEADNLIPELNELYDSAPTTTAAPAAPGGTKPVQKETKEPKHETDTPPYVITGVLVFKHKMPDFPDFDRDWDTPTKVEWFRIFYEILKITRVPETLLPVPAGG